MKNLPLMFEKWERADVFAGEASPIGIVTVEEDWWLNITPSNWGTRSVRGPYRWWQRADNSQFERYLENVGRISINRSIDTDAATCTIEIYNQRMLAHGQVGQPGQLGRPGYYNSDYGVNAEAAARWGQFVNDWNGVLVPNALLRTYQGYGDKTREVSQLIADQSATLTGVWLVDSVTTTSDGRMSLQCRDMAKLLIEQYLVPPLVPMSEYPLEYYRWKNVAIEGGIGGGDNAVATPVSEVGLRYKNSSGDYWYGFNAAIHGHRPTDSLDGRTETYAISVGNGHPSLTSATDYFEYEPEGPIGAIYLHPWMGNYEMYISIKENGHWQSNGEGTIFYSIDNLLASQPSAKNPVTGANEVFVARFNVPWEEGRWYDLPRVYQAERVRVTFRNQQRSPWGPFYYRCGIREIRASNGPNGGVVSAKPQVLGIEHYPLGEGYRTVDFSGKVISYGDARNGERFAGRGAGGISVDMATKPAGTGNGYWVLNSDGTVSAYGDAENWVGMHPIGPNGELVEVTHGIIERSPYRGIIPTHTGNGYVLIFETDPYFERGGLEARGDAIQYHDNLNPDPDAGEGFWLFDDPVAGAHHPSSHGYWIVDKVGHVYAYGTAQYHGGIQGQLQPHEQIVTMRATKTGNGYWILGNMGTFRAFGDATLDNFNVLLLPQYIRDNHQKAENDMLLYADFAVTEDERGMYLLRKSGEIIPVGNALYFGSPLRDAVQREDGNYLDYSDIVKDLLLWAGWLLYEWPPDITKSAPVYGNIESTGAHAGLATIGAEVFDKKPVIDAINQFKEIVGFLFYVDDYGAARFESPNWWASGNFYEDGSHTDFIPEIDERLTLIDYSVRGEDAPLRSEIVIGSMIPTEQNAQTHVTRLRPSSVDTLRGMVKPAMWINEVFTNPDEQRIMAELISLHMWFQQRVGSVTALANPCIQINDQVRIFERTTSESYIHYVRGIATDMDLNSGSYTMNLETHWLGDQQNWVFTRNGMASSNTAVISDMLYAFLKQQQYRALNGERNAINYDQSGKVLTTTNAPDLDPNDPNAQGAGTV